MRFVQIMRFALGAAMLLPLLACTGESDADLIASAKRALAKNDPQSAVVNLKSALSKSPNSGEARLLLGEALLLQDNPFAALVEFKKAEEAGVDETSLVPKYAQTMLSLGQFKAVIDKFGQRQLTDPRARADLLTIMATAHGGMGNRAEAHAALDKALAEVPGHPFSLRVKANFTAATGKFDEALKILAQAFEPNRPNGEAWLLRGEILRGGMGDPKGAADAYRKAAEDPKVARAARYALVELQVARGEIKEAQAEVQALVKSSPNAVRTRFLEALVAFELGEFARCREIAGQLASKVQTDARYHTLAGVAALRLGSPLQAESSLGRAVSLEPTWRLPRWRLAEAYLQLGQAGKARSTLAPIIEGKKPDATSLALQGSAYLQEGDVENADSFFTRAKAQNPTDASIRTSAALLDLAKGDTAQAFGELQSISSTDSGIGADMALISAALGRQDLDVALSAIVRLKTKQPSSPVPDQLRGVVLLQKGDLAGARQAFEQALKSDPKFFAATTKLVDLDLYTGQPADARKRIEEAIKLDPKNVQIRMSLVSILAQQGRPRTEIRAVLDDAIRAQPQEPVARLALLALLRDSGDTKEALAVAQAAITALPDQPEILDAVGQAQVAAGEQQQAISTFGKLASVRPGSPVGHIRLADLHVRRNDRAAVMASLRRALEVAPESADVQVRLIAHAKRTKDTAAVSAVARELQQKFPQRAVGFLLEADLLMSATEYKKAEGAYRSALGKPDPSQRAATGVYLAKLGQGQKQEAERFVEDWMKSNPRESGTRLRLGERALRQGAFAAASRLLAEAAANDPRNLAALSLQVQAEAARDNKDALPLAMKAVARVPGEPMVHAALAKLLLVSGRVDESIPAMRRAVTLSGGRPELRLELAKILHVSGKRDEAKVEIDALAALGPSFSRASEVAALQRLR